MLCKTIWRLSVGWSLFRGLKAEIKESAYIQGTMARGYLIQGGPRRIEGQRTPTAGCLLAYRVKADVDNNRNAKSGGGFKHGIKGRL